MSGTESNGSTSCACSDETGSTRDNPPDRTAIRYRIGDYGAFLERMREGISTEEIASGPNEGTRPLAALTTRDSADPTVGVLDAFACLADVFTFYQERIANEHYLRTATERYSLVEQASQVGYQLAPGLAASAWLAFTLDDTESAADEVTVPALNAVMSVPGKGETPQTFETTKDLVAYKSLNALTPLMSRSQDLLATMTGGAPQVDQIVLAGIGLRISVGDRILFILPKASATGTDLPYDAYTIRRAVEVSEVRTTGRTIVRFASPLAFDAPIVGPPPDTLEVHVFRARMNAFAYNAPDWTGLPQTVKDSYLQLAGGGTAEQNWPGYRAFWEMVGTTPSVELIGMFSGENRSILANSWAQLTCREQNDSPPLRVISAVPGQYADFSITDKLTELTLDASAPNTFDPVDYEDRRTLVAHVQSEILTLSELDFGDDVELTSVEIDGSLVDLPVGRQVLVTGVRVGANLPAAELATVSANSGNLVTFSKPLTYSYLRKSVVIYANVGEATHGESTQETLGSGDASLASQTFSLTGLPLTYTADDSETGRASSLVVRVGGLPWKEVESFYEAGATDEVYTVHHGDDGSVTLTFGDGTHGARLPTGVENVKASYRKGIGEEGNVLAGKLTLLKARPIGVRSVANPLPATGGEAPETMEGARVAAPRSVRVLERLVTVGDFGDFASLFAGVGLAGAVCIRRPDISTSADDERKGRLDARPIVVVSALDAAGAPLLDSSAVYASLDAALTRYSAPGTRYVLVPGRPVWFDVEAGVVVEDGHDPEVVVKAAADALEYAFSPTFAVFHQPVTIGDVARVLREVDGVGGVDVRELYRATGTPNSGLNARLCAADVEIIADGILGAEVLLIRTMTVVEATDE